MRWCPPVLLLRILPACLLALQAFAGAAQDLRLPLHQGWLFTKVGEEQWHEAEVPGTVHTDLMRHGLIPDPFREVNVDSVQWVEREDWLYRLAFEVPATVLDLEHAELVFEGLDTYATVSLNGRQIDNTENMFRAYRWPVRQWLVPGRNVLEVRFRSAVEEGRKRKAAYGITLPHDSDTSGVAPFVRKAAYQFGWDFAPRLVTCGIWRPVELHAWNDNRCMFIHVEQQHGPRGVDVTVRPAFFPGRPKRPMRLVCKLDGRPVASATWKTTGSVPPLMFRVAGRDLWWPTGRGPRTMHRIGVELWDGKRLVAAHEQPIAWRTVRLHQEPDSMGTPFTLVINGEPVFAKGANVVPPDMFLPRAGDSAWVDLVRHAQHLNMNMLRVWAGGVYPPEAFFQACDTAGIMVWQDFMFAYLRPHTEEHRLEAISEAVHQVLRIGHHPSLVLWCGNNELDVAWHNWGWQRTYGLHGEDSSRVWDAHRAFFHDGELAAPVGWYGQVPYVPNSPLSNWGGPEGFRHGSMHYWGVWHADSTFASYTRNVGRFMAEYGFQSWPDSAVMARWIDPVLLYRASPAVAARQRSYRTDKPIEEALLREEGVVPRDYAAFALASQRMQAIALSTAIRSHLEAAPRCMGSLLWQLNEPWPGASWSLIAYGGVPKLAYPIVRQAFKSTP